MKEIWKKIEKFENYYVSNLGNVKSYQKLKNGTTLKPINDSGYLYVNLCNSNSRKKNAIHRLVAIHFLDNKENKKEVNHINGIKNDNRIENLEWCTSSENTKHSYKIGLQKKGNHKLTNEDLNFIKENSSLKSYKLAKILNVCSSTIRIYLRKYKK